MKKRFYNKDDIRLLKQKSEIFGEIRSLREGCTFGSCQVLHKRRTIRNPFKKKYTERFEPERLKHYQIQFIIDEGYLPIGKIWHLSHRCHNRLCINTTHIRCERKSKNHSRDGCKRVMEKIKKKKNETLCCKKHNPCFFF